MKNILNYLLVFTIAIIPFTAQAGCLSGDCINGKGKAIYYETNNNSYTYEGNFVNGKWEGDGLLIIPDNATYKGTFKNGEVTGKGEITYADGNKYVGEVVNLNKEGEGLYTYKNGQTFKGIFKAGNVWTGEGYIFMSEKAYYKGSVLNGKQHGKGLLRFEDGATYEGTFNQGEGTGTGEIIYADGNKYTGEVVDLKKEGEGILTHKNGQTFKGLFKGDNIWSGEGYVSLSEKSYYKGTIQDGQQHGNGFIRYEDGTTYEGDFDKGKVTGQGTIIYNEGTKYIGAVSNGVRNGYGKLYDKYGKLLFEGMWVKDNAQQNNVQNENEQYKKVFNRCFEGFEKLTLYGQTGNAKINFCGSASDNLSITGTYTYTITVDGKDYVSKTKVSGTVNKSKNSFTLYDVESLRKDKLPYDMYWIDSDSGTTFTIYNHEAHKGYYVLKGKSVTGNRIELTDW